MILWIILLKFHLYDPCVLPLPQIQDNLFYLNNFSVNFIRMRGETCCYFSGARFSSLVFVEISGEGEDKGGNFEYTHQALQK